jgi:hypothetical protein
MLGVCYYKNTYMSRKVQRQIVTEIIVVIEDDSLTNEQIVAQLTIKGPNKAIKVTSYGTEPEPA